MQIGTKAVSRRKGVVFLCGWNCGCDGFRGSRRWLLRLGRSWCFIHPRIVDAYPDAGAGDIRGGHTFFMHGEMHPAFFTKRGNDKARLVLSRAA